MAIANVRMETESLFPQCAPSASVDATSRILPSKPISESSIPPLKPTKMLPMSKKRERTLSETMAEIPCVQDVEFRIRPATRFLYSYTVTYVFLETSMYIIHSLFSLCFSLKVCKHQLQ